MAANNHKDWFDRNRERYHENIKIPFETFVTRVIEEVHKQDANFVAEPKKAIFRINRDIRFSKDKTPYKLNRSAFISRHGKKDNRPGLYVQLGPEMVRIGGGVYSPEKEELMQIRNAIARNPKALHKALDSSDFKKYFGKLFGKENKRLPNVELTAAAKEEPLIFKKQFFYMAEFPPEKVTDPKLVPLVVKHYMAAKPVADFFEKAMSS